MICFLNCMDRSTSHMCYCRMHENGITYAIRHEPSHFPIHMSISAIATMPTTTAPSSNSSEETSRWNCETERTSSTGTEFGGGGDDLRNAMSDGDLLESATIPCSNYPFMSARGVDFVFTKGEPRIPQYSYCTPKRRRPSLAQISQVSVDSNFSARLDSAGLKIERIRLRSINCKLSAKLEIRRRAERRRFRDRKLSDSSDSESPAVRPKTSSSSTRRAKRESPHTSKSLLSSSLPTDTEDEHEAAKDKEDAHSSVNNLSENLRLFSVHNGEAEPAPLPESPPRVPYLFLAQNSEDSSSRLSEPTKRDEFEKISYEREMRNILLKKEAELKPASWNSPKETSTRSNASHVVFERDENGDFRPASTYFRIHRASLPTFGYNDSGFNWEKQRQWQDEQTRQRNTIFEENNIDLVTDGFSLPQESGDADGVNEGGEDDEDKDESQVENNRSEGSEIILEVSTTTKSDHTFPAEVPLTPGLQDLRDPPRNNSLPPLTPGKPKDSASSATSAAPGVATIQLQAHWFYEISMCRLLKLLFQEKERLETTITSTSTRMPLTFVSTNTQLAQEKYRQHLRDNLRKVQNRIDVILNQLAKPKNKTEAA